MLDHLLAIVGLAILTALWTAFQLWLKKQDPQREDRCTGCGANCRRGKGGTDPEFRSRPE